MKKITALFLALLLLCSALFLSSCSSDGREIYSAVINEKGELVLTYTDGSSSNLGVVKGSDGANGQDGADGKNGLDGVDGQNGRKGQDGQAGANGLNGQNGRGIQSITQNADGALVITYDDGSEPVVLDLMLGLLGGSCGEKVEWALYTGGILMIVGEGRTYDYALGATPWNALISGIRAVYIDTLAVTPGNNLLSGLEGNVPIITPETAATPVWVDMTVSASVYSDPSLEESTKVGEAAFGTQLKCVEMGESVSCIVYNGAYAYVETRYINPNSGSLVFNDVPGGSKQMQVVAPNGLNLRTYTDATDTSNLVVTLATGDVVKVTGISENGNWARIEYEVDTEPRILYGRVVLNDVVYLQDVPST